jgi:CubicO group peptidase (beta-lactamase class C family)
MRRRIGLRKSVAAGLLCVVSCAAIFHPGAAGQSPPKRAAAPKAAAAPPHHVDPRSLHVDQLFAKFASGQSPGAAVLVAVDGVVVHKKGYGFANLSARHRIDEGTNFRLCSVTKPFTALAVTILAEQGKLRYDDPLTNFFPQFPAWGKEVTVRHLLHHLSGMPDHEKLLMDTGLLSKNWPRSARLPHDRFEPTIRETLQVLARQPGPNFPPGSKFEYSNAGYAVLAAVIERASRKSYAEFLKEHIFHPANMKYTVVYDERKPHIPKPAISYAREGAGFRDIDYTPLNLIVGDEGVFSNIDDMFRWEEAFFGGRIVPQRVLDEALRPATLPGGGQTTYGFGWGLGDLDGHSRISHGGAWVGFRTDISRFPKDRLCVIVLSNFADINAAEFSTKVAEIYLGAGSARQDTSRSTPRSRGGSRRSS